MAVNIDVLMLVSLSFTMSLTMRMNIIATSLTIVTNVHDVHYALGMEVRNHDA